MTKLEIKPIYLSPTGAKRWTVTFSEPVIGYGEDLKTALDRFWDEVDKIKKGECNDAE